jgi:hypothetical protein
VDAKTLISLYTSISKVNPHYTEANERLVVLYTADLFPDTSPFLYLEKQLTAAVEAKNKILISQIFNQLCSYKGLTPVVENLILDAESLIALARHIRMLNSTIEKQNSLLIEQKNKIDSQAKEIDTLKGKDESTNKPTFFS